MKLISDDEIIIIINPLTLKWLISAIICTVIGMIIAIIDCIFPHKFSTVLEVDYDTPYDRHIIIEDSHETRDKNNKKKLEEPPQPSIGIGSKLLR